MCEDSTRLHPNVSPIEKKLSNALRQLPLFQTTMIEVGVKDADWTTTTAVLSAL